MPSFEPAVGRLGQALCGAYSAQALGLRTSGAARYGNRSEG